MPHKEPAAKRIPLSQVRAIKNIHNPPLSQRSIPWPEHKLAPAAHSATSRLLVPFPSELIPIKIAARITNDCVKKKSTCSAQSQFSYWTSDNPRLRKQKA